MGGATPADPPGFLSDGDVPNTGIPQPHDPRGWSSIPDALSEGLTLYEMYRDGGDPTLKLYLGYQTDADKNVVGITVIIDNSGASSARLGRITLTETGRPSFTFCTINTICYFRPVKTVETEPGQVTTVTICKNCLSNGVTIFNSPFYSNKNSQIKVQVSMSMIWSEDGHTKSYIRVPFIYTIPWRY